MKNPTLFLLMIATVFSVSACKKTSLTELKVETSPLPTPSQAVQTYGRFKIQDRISWYRNGVAENGGISLLYTTGKARIYLNTYNPDGAYGGPEEGVPVDQLGLSHRCVQNHCRQDSVILNGVKGGIHEIYDNGTFRFSDGKLYGIDQIDSTFRCHPKNGTAECDVSVAD